MSQEPGRQGRLDRIFHPEGHPRVVGVFTSLEACLQAIRRAKAAGFERLVVHSPIPSREIEEAMPKGPGVIRHFTLIGGILGGAGGFTLATLVSFLWNHNTGGKPIVSVPPFLIITFECAILLAGISTLLGFLLSARLPQPALSQAYRDRFGEDRFGVGVVCAEAEAGKAEQVLRQAGAEEVFRVEA
jgi:hypothetical protein